MKKTILALILGLSLMACNAFAITTSTTYTFADTWVNWPGYTSSLGDENGTPEIDSMNVIVSDDKYLQSVRINLRSNSYQYYDSLFISTGGPWDSWDYFVHSGGNNNISNTSGTVAANGLYSVNDGFSYTYVTNKNRIGNPNGIDANSLTSIDSSFVVTHGDSSIFYDFSSLITNAILFDIDSFFVAYAPWCDNDIIGGGTAPVPEPATMVLLGSGLVGLAFYRRRMKK